MDKEAGMKDSPNYRQCKRGNDCCGECVYFKAPSKRASVGMCRKHKFLCGARNTCDDFERKGS